MNDVSKESLAERHGHYMRVGDLRKALANPDLSDDAIVLIEHVDDIYYERGRDVVGFSSPPEDGTTGVFPKDYHPEEWPVVLRDGYWGWHMKDHNRKVDSGYYADPKNFPEPHPEHKRRYTDEEIRQAMTKFAPAYCCGVGGKDDKDVFFIHMHY
jgi:hypothetical protein